MLNNNRVIAIAWYRENHWDGLLSCSVDSCELESSYKEWLAQAAAKIAKLRKSGINVVKVNVDVNELQKWCKKKRLPINGEARSLYAAHAARNKKNILG